MSETFVMTPEIRQLLLRAYEAAIEQAEALALMGGAPRSFHRLIAAMKDYNDGDETALREWLGRKP